MGTNSLRLTLFLTRLSVFYFLLPWQLMRFFKPEAVKAIAGKHYYMETFPNGLSLAIGIFAMISLLAFLIGFKKRISYAAVFIIHAVGTILIVPKLILFTDSLVIVFLASLPALGAMALLYVLRDEDTMLSLNR